MPEGQGYDTPEQLLQQLQQLKAQQAQPQPPQQQPGNPLGLLALLKQMQGQPPLPQQYRPGGLAGLLVRLAQGPATSQYGPTGPPQQPQPQGQQQPGINNLMQNVNQRNALLEELDRQAQGGR